MVFFSSVLWMAWREYWLPAGTAFVRMLLGRYRSHQGPRTYRLFRTYQCLRSLRSVSEDPDRWIYHEWCRPCPAFFVRENPRLRELVPWAPRCALAPRRCSEVQARSFFLCCLFELARRCAFQTQPSTLPFGFTQIARIGVFALLCDKKNLRPNTF